ncbi:endonuclease/exonuclease/phosphatase family protein, partial [Cribrihabitans sp. XS_ASV171]
VFCPFAAVGGVAVLSRFPKVPGSETCVAMQGLAAMRVETPLGKVTLASIHLHWPWPHGQAAQVDRLLPVLEALPRPVILAGDFNAVGWSHSVARIARATGNERIGPHAGSFVLPHVPYPVTIDHVLAPGGAAEVMPRLGSDHFGVLARVLPD